MALLAWCLVVAVRQVVLLLLSRLVPEVQKHEPVKVRNHNAFFCGKSATAARAQAN
jgi:hypothetical protein